MTFTWFFFLSHFAWKALGILFTVLGDSMVRAHKVGSQCICMDAELSRELRIREPEGFQSPCDPHWLEKLGLWSPGDAFPQCPARPCPFFHACVLLVLARASSPLLHLLPRKPPPSGTTRASFAEASPVVMKVICRPYWKATFEHSPSQPEHLILCNAFFWEKVPPSLLSPSDPHL